MLETKLISERLKSLREDQHLSHAKLAEELKKISDEAPTKNTLIDYERTDADNKKYGANLGMSTRILDLLASFYGVSTDYILCRTDIRTQRADITAICNATGLSQTIVENLIAWNDEHKQTRASNERSTTRTEIANRVFDFLTSYKVAAEFVKLDKALRSPKHSRIGHEDEIINKRIQLSKEAESIDYSILTRNEYITFRCQILERQFSDFLAIFCMRPQKQRIFR